MPDPVQQQQPDNSAGAGFDPNAYAAQNSAAASDKSSAFDPSAYIAQANNGFNPDKYLDEEHSKLANTVLAKYQAGAADMNDSALSDVVKQAYKDHGPWKSVGNWLKGVGQAAISPQGAAEHLWSGAKTAYGALNELGTLLPNGERLANGPTPAESAAQTQAVKNVAAGAAGAPMDLLNVGTQLGVGAANVVDEFGPGHEQRRLDRIARAAKTSHDLNAAAQGANEYLGADPQDPLNESTRFLAQALFPVGGAGKLAGPIAKGANLAIEAAPTIAKYGAPAMAGGGLLVAGLPKEAAEVVAAGYGLPLMGKMKIVRGLIGKARQLAEEAAPETEGTFSGITDALSKAPSQTPVFQYMKDGVDEQITSLQKMADKFKDKNTAKLDMDAVTDPTIKTKHLKGADLELRSMMEQITTLQTRSDKLKTMADINKVLTYSGKLGLGAAGQIAAGGGIMSGIAASGAVPAQQQEAAKQGFYTGEALEAPFALPAAKNAMLDLRMQRGRDALAGRGAQVVDPAALQGLTPGQKNNALTTAGAASAVGVKTVPLDPGDYSALLAQKQSASGSVPAPQQTAVVNAPNGHYDPTTKTIYLNKATLGEGTAGHELQHPLQQLWGEMLREGDPEWIQTYDALLKKSGQTRTNSSQAERDAEVGRVLLQNTPLEYFYGGEQGNDVVKRVADNILGRNTDATVGTTTLGAPYSKTDLAQMSQRMFKLGEIAKKAPDIVNQVDQVARAPQVIQAVDNIAKSTTTATTVKPQAQQPAVKSSSVDYEGIRKQAEVDKTDELRWTKRKSKGQEIERAGIEAMAQAHAKDLPEDSDAVTWRTDKYGRSYIGGRSVDPTDPFHAHLIAKANLKPEDAAKLNFYEKNLGKSTVADYQSAPEETQPSGTSRREEQGFSQAQARVEGQAPVRRLQKTFVPTGFRFELPSKRFTVQGFSPDKLLNNARALIPWAKRIGLKVWDGPDDPTILRDLQAKIENNKNGYTAMGEPIKSTPPVVNQDPDYEPHSIPKDRADLLNLALNDASASKTTRQPSAGTPEAAVKERKWDLARENSPYWDEQTGETNKLRAMMNDPKNAARITKAEAQFRAKNPEAADEAVRNHLLDKGFVGAKDLESPWETLRPELHDNVRLGEAADEKTIRPVGAQGERGKFTDKGTPNSLYTSAGFMPAVPKQFETLAKQYGLKYNGEFPEGEPKMHLFSDPVAKTTFSVPLDAKSADLQKKLMAARERMNPNPGDDMPQFMPSPHADAITYEAVKLPNGKVYTGVMHMDAAMNAMEAIGASWSYVMSGTMGYVTKQGKFLDRQQAHQHALAIGQTTKKRLTEAEKHFGGRLIPGPGLESIAFKRAKVYASGGVVSSNAND